MQGNTKSTKFKIGDLVTVVGLGPTQYEVIDLQAHGDCVIRIPGDLMSWGATVNEWWLEPVEISEPQNTEQ